MFVEVRKAAYAVLTKRYGAVLLASTTSYRTLLCMFCSEIESKPGRCLRNNREIRVGAQNGLYFCASHTVHLRKSVSPWCVGECNMDGFDDVGNRIFALLDSPKISVFARHFQ
jgi:hypothetical protein